MREERQEVWRAWTRMLPWGNVMKCDEVSKDILVGGVSKACVIYVMVLELLALIFVDNRITDHDICYRHFGRDYPCTPIPSSIRNAEDVDDTLISA